jgi:hypothetical protein
MRREDRLSSRLRDITFYGSRAKTIVNGRAFDEIQPVEKESPHIPWRHGNID